jgi:glycosyltransferase involved in cell wall biosynthesis
VRLAGVSSCAVIIPAYNRSTTIQRAVQSVTSQRGDARCYVFDDGSTDNTADLAKLAGAIVYRSPERVGQCEARNYFMPRVKAEFLKWLDSDDYLINSMVLMRETRAAETDGAEVVISPWVTHETSFNRKRTVGGAWPNQQIGACTFRTAFLIDNQLSWDDDFKAGGADRKFFSDVLAVEGLQTATLDEPACVREMSIRDRTSGRYWK